MNLKKDSSMLILILYLNYSKTGGTTMQIISTQTNKLGIHIIWGNLVNVETAEEEWFVTTNYDGVLKSYYFATAEDAEKKAIELHDKE